MGQNPLPATFVRQPIPPTTGRSRDRRANAFQHCIDSESGIKFADSIKFLIRLQGPMAHILMNIRAFDFR